MEGNKRIVSVFLVLILNGHLPSGQATSTVLLLLDKVQGVSRNITSAIDKWHTYKYDGRNGYILDGGNDMFDTGNEVKFGKYESSLKTADYDHFYQDKDYEFSTRTTHPFMALMWIKGENNIPKSYTISVSGRSGIYYSYYYRGSHGKSLNLEGVFSMNNFKVSYNIYQIYGQIDPSICMVFFYVTSKQAWNSDSGTFTFSTSNGVTYYNTKAIVSGTPKRGLLGYMLLSAYSYTNVSQSGVVNSLKKMIQSFVGNSPVCGGFINVTELTSSRKISSPQYPSNYKNDQFCEWILYDPSEHYFLTFTDFHTEACQHCDNVTITRSTGVTTTISGEKTSLPSSYVLNGRTVVKFFSDHSNTYKGFTANLWTCRQTIIVSSTSQEITSPLYPDNSPPDLNCEWILESNKTGKIKLVFNTFESYSSYYTSVRIVHEGRRDIILQGTQRNLPIIITGNKKMTVKFSSGSYYVGKFQATVTDGTTSSFQATSLSTTLLFLFLSLFISFTTL